MPKDPTKNVDRYKVQGGHLNEYEFQQGKAADKKEADWRPTDNQQADKQQTLMPREKVDKTPSEEDKTQSEKNPKH